MKTIKLLFISFCLVTLSGFALGKVFSGVPVDSIISFKEQANKLNLDLNTFCTAKIYAKLMTYTGIKKDSINAWKAQAGKRNTDLNTYLTALIYTNLGGSVVAGSGTINSFPIFTASTTIGTSNFSQINLGLKYKPTNVILGSLDTYTSIPGLYMTSSTATPYNYSLSHYNDKTYLNGYTGLNFATNGVIKSSLNSEAFYVNDKLLVGSDEVSNPPINETFNIFKYYSNASLSLSYASINRGVEFLTPDAVTSYGISSIFNDKLTFGRFNVSGSANGYGFVCGVNGDFSLHPDYYSGNTDFIYKGSTGNIGIGTASPSSKLTLNGSLQLISLPTSSVGLPSGSVYNSSGTLKIVP